MTVGVVHYFMRLGFLTPETTMRMPTHKVRAATPKAQLYAGRTRKGIAPKDCKVNTTHANIAGHHD